MSIEIKPCPFCGNNPYRSAQENRFECRGITCPIQWEVMTIKEWNTRAQASSGVMVDRDVLTIVGGIADGAVESMGVDSWPDGWVDAVRSVEALLAEDV